MFQSTGIPIPALRGRQGTRTMYLTLPRNKVLNNFFPREFEADPDNARSQRPYDPKRAEQIGDYMAHNRGDYVLGALTYAMDVEGSFQEAEPGSNIGILNIPLDARLRSTDGQHRRGGIKEALDVLEELGEDHTAMLIYVERDLQKRRQMFSDMNWHQRPVAKSVNVGFDRRDPFARVTQRLVAEHPLLIGRIETERSSVAYSSGNLFTQGAVYDALGRCVAGVGGRVRNRERWEDNDQELYDIGTSFFDLLVAARPEFRGILSGEMQPVDVRNGTILASSTTLRAIAGAYHIATKKSLLPADLVDGLRSLDFSPDHPQWHRIGFVSPGKATPNARLQEVKAATDFIASAISSSTAASAAVS